MIKWIDGYLHICRGGEWARQGTSRTTASTSMIHGIPFFSILYSGIRITRNIYMYISSVHMILYNVVCVLRMLHCCWCYSPFPYLPMHCAKQCARRAVPHANRKHFRKTHNTQPLTYKPKFQFMRYNFNCHDSMVGLSFSPTTECINVHIP